MPPRTGATRSVYTVNRPGIARGRLNLWSWALSANASRLATGRKPPCWTRFSKAGASTPWSG